VGNDNDDMMWRKLEDCAMRFQADGLALEDRMEEARLQIQRLEEQIDRITADSGAASWDWLPASWARAAVEAATCSVLGER